MTQPPSRRTTGDILAGSTATAQTLEHLRAEGEELDSLVAALPDRSWRLPTPAAGWTVAHQVGHLLWSDEIATLAMRSPAAFAQIAERVLADGSAVVDAAAAESAALPTAELLARWRSGRETLLRLLDDADPGTRIVWFGPSMSRRSMATARLMETWVHGTDVADALGVRRTPTGRLRDIAHLGVRTRDFAHRLHGRPVPDHDFRVELQAPGGGTWTWGPEDAADRVTGPAEDFCLVVAQRRSVARTRLRVMGDAAAQWLTFAQVFAGPPTRGRPDDAPAPRLGEGGAAR